MNYGEYRGAREGARATNKAEDWISAFELAHELEGKKHNSTGVHE